MHFDETATTNAAKNGKYDVVKFLYDIDVYFDETSIIEAGKNGHMDIAKWIFNRLCKNKYD